jgi:hypothetical protein
MGCAPLSRHYFGETVPTAGCGAGTSAGAAKGPRIARENSMNKLQLDVENLTVESFATVVAPTPAVAEADAASYPHICPTPTVLQTCPC